MLTVCLNFFVFSENYGAKSQIYGETEEQVVGTSRASTDSFSLASNQQWS